LIVALYAITYSCGHAEDRQIFGKHADRERFIAWAARHGACRACCASNAALVRDAVEAANGLPPLVGSDKQIEWARTIRAEKVTAVTDYCQKMVAKVPADKMAMYEDHCAAVAQHMMGQSSASWWIDNRHEAAASLTEKLYREARNVDLYRDTRS
jgi:hypothetical protein